MSRLLSAVVLFVCCIVAIPISAQVQPQPQTKLAGMVLEITLIETTGAKPDEIDRIEKTKDQLGRLTNEGKARIVATVQVRTRLSENFSARIGQRVPVQTGSVPVVRNADSAKRDASGATPITSVAIPQIAYENTGLNVEGISSAAGDGLIDIRLKIEMTGLDVSTGMLTPTFVQRTFNNVVRMKESETAILLSFLNEAFLSRPQSGSGPMDSARRTFVVLLSTKPVQ